MELEFINLFVGILIIIIIITSSMISLALLLIVGAFVFNITRKIIQKIDSFFDNL